MRNELYMLFARKVNVVILDVIPTSEKASRHKPTKDREKSRPWSRLGLVQFFETETVLVSEGPIPR